MKLVDFLKLEKKDLIGKLICFPTDTVYGVGILFNDSLASKKLYALKERSFNKPLATLASKIDDILPYVAKINDETKKAMNAYWPGALTIIFSKNDDVNFLVNENFDTIGFRIPNSKIALAILEKFGPLMTTSVNKSGEAPLNTYEDIMKYFGKKIDYIIEDQEIMQNVASTVIDATSNQFIVIREGLLKIGKN